MALKDYHNDEEGQYTQLAVHGSFVPSRVMNKVNDQWWQESKNIPSTVAAAAVSALLLVCSGSSRNRSLCVPLPHWPNFYYDILVSFAKVGKLANLLEALFKLTNLAHKCADFANTLDVYG